MNLDSIPDGHTQRGVNRAVIEYFLSTGEDYRGKSFLDIPCGSGVFLTVLTRFFPGCNVLGGDIKKNEAVPSDHFIIVDATQDFHLPGDGTFDVITSISGVMEFDNTAGFIRECVKHLNVGGRIIITNDNVVTVRDRLSFLFFGRVRRFKLFLQPKQPTYKYIPLQELYKIFLENDLVFERVQYTSLWKEDFLFLPLALPLFAIQYLYIVFVGSPIDRSIRLQLFPFESLLCRHYFIAGRKK